MTETITYDNPGSASHWYFIPTLQLSFFVAPDGQVVPWRGHDPRLDDAGRPIPPTPQQAALQRVFRASGHGDCLISNVRRGMTLTAEQVEALVRIVLLEEQTEKAKTAAAHLFVS